LFQIPKVEGQIEGDFLKKLPPQMDVISSTDAEFTVEITKELSDVTWLRLVVGNHKQNILQ
jgi:hypothetical protein